MARGPLLEVWLCVRNRRQWGDRLLPGVMRLLSFENLPGTPLALLRPELAYGISCLKDPDNGFGGFYAPRPVSDYKHVDGNGRPRVLYIYLTVPGSREL